MFQILFKIIAMPNMKFDSFKFDNQIDITITEKTLAKAIKTINDHPSFNAVQKKELIKIINTIYLEAFPYYIKSRKFNFIFHALIVCYNTIKIATAEKLTFSEFKNALALALLHDIGNANCEGKKITSAMIKKVIAENKTEEAVKLAKTAIAFRFEHMNKAEPIINNITDSLVKSNLFSKEDIKLICEATKIHDYPSIENTIKELNKLGISMPYKPGDYLFNFNNAPLQKLTNILHEADTLFILSWPGILSDLIREKTPINLNSVSAKLNYNLQKFYAEYKLYKDSNKDDGKFIEGTHLRSQKAWQLFQNTKSAEEIYKKITNLPTTIYLNPLKIENVLTEISNHFKSIPAQKNELLMNFQKEIELGLAGKSTNFRMNPSYLNSESLKNQNPNNPELLAIDFGGSTLRIIKIDWSSKESTPKIIYNKSFLLDATIKNITKGEELFDIIAKKIKETLVTLRLDKKTLHIGFAFSFPFEQISKNSVTLIEWAKGFKANNVIGKNPITFLEAALVNNGLSNVKISAVANDAVTNLIAGLQFSDCNISFIVGTSTNIAWEIPTKFITKKINHYNDKKIIVDFNSSSRLSYPEQQFANRFDLENPDMYNKDKTIRIGKLFTGNILGSSFRTILKHCTNIEKENHPLNNKNLYLSKLLTEITNLDNSLLKSKINYLFSVYKLDLQVQSEENAKKIKSIAELIVKRAGFLAATFMIGTVKFLDPSLTKPHTIAIDGSIFENNKLFCETIYQTFKEENIQNISLKQIKDGSGIGAAMLSN